MKYPRTWDIVAFCALVGGVIVLVFLFTLRTSPFRVNFPTEPIYTKHTLDWVTDSTKQILEDPKGYDELFKIKFCHNNDGKIMLLVSIFCLHHLRPDKSNEFLDGWKNPIQIEVVEMPVSDGGSQSEIDFWSIGPNRDGKNSASNEFRSSITLNRPQ